MSGVECRVSGFGFGHRDLFSRLQGFGYRALFSWQKVREVWQRGDFVSGVDGLGFLGLGIRDWALGFRVQALEGSGSGFRL